MTNINRIRIILNIEKLIFSAVSITHKRAISFISWLFHCK